MEIRINCPACGTLYHLPASMLGKSMRCPLGSCKTVFPVELPKPVTLVDLLPGEAVATPDVPLVPIEPATPAAEPKPKPAWAEAPPPVRDPNANGRAELDGPKVVDHASWDAPPVRRGKGQDSSPGKTAKERKPPESEAEIELTPVAPAHTRLMRILIPLACVVVVVVLGVGGVWVWMYIRDTEKRLAAAADAAYEETKFRQAQEKYEFVAKRFPDSASKERYDFRARLSEIRYKIGNDPEGIGDLLEEIEKLIDDFEKKPVLSEHASDIGEALVKLLVDFANKNIQDENVTAALNELKDDKVDGVVRKASSIKPAEGSPRVSWAAIEEARKKLDEKAALARQYKSILDSLEHLVKEPSYRSLRLAERLIDSEKEMFPNLPNDPKVKDALEKIMDGHLKSARYVREGVTAIPGEEDDQPALLVGPLIAGTPGNGGGTVLALARGVLYGLDEKSGRIRWARRVGIDTTTLPVRVPAGDGSGERILALSSDTATLAALDPLDGTALWRYQLGAPVLGRPAVVGRRAYLATFNGEVHEIELAEGRLIGRYLLNHRLIAGPTHDPSTNRLYVAADDGCVYVLKIGADPKCELILYTRHDAASLRGEPIIIPPAVVGGQVVEPGYLIMNQTAGLRATDLKVYDLPLAGRDAQPRPLKEPAEIDGWTWFPPYFDPEKLVLLTDDGRLGAFGIRQAGTNDPPLFRLLPRGGLKLEAFHGGAAGVRGRSTTVRVQGNDYWTLALGHLQHLRLAWDGREGPKLTSVWGKPLRVGSPLHEGQTVSGGRELMVVTQPPGRSTVWATCVEERQGGLRWRRQLGLVCRGEPVAVPMAGGGPVLLMQDQGGALFEIDPARFKVGKGDRWVSAGNMKPLAGSLDDNPAWPPVVLTADGKTFYMAANPGGGKELVIRKVTAGAGRSLDVEERTVTLSGSLAGPPALAGDFLVMALNDSDGTLVRVPLAGGEPDYGPNWRLARVTADASGFVLGLDDGRLVTTDGARGLYMWKWAAGMNQMELPQGRGDEPTLLTPARVIAAPVRVPGAAVRFAVADVQGLSLIEVLADGSLKQVRRWPVAGLSGGPHVMATPGGVRLAAVVNQSRLMWIDPEKADALWTHPRDGESALVGTPYLHAGRVMIADQAGRYVGLKLEDGTPAGPGYTLRGSIGPAAGVVGFNDGRLLCPLTDGTLLLLDAAKLMK